MVKFLLFERKINFANKDGASHPKEKHTKIKKKLYQTILDEYNNENTAELEVLDIQEYKNIKVKQISIILKF